MAGLWDSWEVRDDTGKKTGELLDTFTILTVDATEDVQAILPGIVGHRLRPANEGSLSTGEDIARTLIAAVAIP